GTDEAKESFGVMLRHAVRLERLINDLLDASQIEMDQPVIRTEKIDLVQMIGEVVAEGEPEQGPPILFEPKAPRAMVHADRFRTRQVLTNLISNARKHSPPDAAVRVGTSTENGTCVVSVTDRGMGIPAPEQERIFERFY